MLFPHVHFPDKMIDIFCLWCIMKLSMWCNIVAGCLVASISEILTYFISSSHYVNIWDTFLERFMYSLRWHRHHIWCQWSMSISHQVMACCLFIARPLTESVLTHLHWICRKQTLLKIEQKGNNIHHNSVTSLNTAPQPPTDNEGLAGIAIRVEDNVHINY